MEQPKLKMADCPITLMNALHSARTLPREQVLSALLELATLYIAAIVPKGTDEETQQVLAVHEISEIFRRAEKALENLPDDESESEVIGGIQ